MGQGQAAVAKRSKRGLLPQPGDAVSCVSIVSSQLQSTLDATYKARPETVKHLNNMKKFLLLTLLSLLLSFASAHAVAALPGFESLRAETLTQLTIASNNVANEIDVKANQSLIKTLQGALKLIDKTKPDYGSGARALGSLTKTYNRTTVSNAFHPVLEGTFNSYIASLRSDANQLQSRLNSTFPGKARTSAETSMTRLVAAIDAAETTADLAAAIKLLATAGKSLGAAQKAVVKAENAPLPPAQYRATITGALFGTFNFTPNPKEAIAAVYNAPVNQLIINGVSGTTSGSGLNTKATTRQLAITIPNLTDGTTTYEVGNGGGKAFVLYTIVRGGINGSDGADGYQATSGTLTVTVNKAARTAVGTFSFNAPGSTNPSSVASTSNGTFSVVWRE